MGSSRIPNLIITALRWLARSWGLGLLIFGIVRLLVPDPNLSPDMHWTEAIPPVLIIGGAAVGSLIAWRREELGGVIVLAGWLGGWVAERIIGGRWLPLDAILLLGLFAATPGILFLICWFASRGQEPEPAQPFISDSH